MDSITNISTNISFLVAQQPLEGQDLLIIEASRTHSDIAQSVGLLWTCDQLDAQTTHNILRRQDIMSQWHSNPQSQTSERPQNDALDHAVTGIDIHQYYRD